MGRRQEKLEAERSYELVTRKRAETGTFWKGLLKFLFSHVGLVILCIAVAVIGAELYIQVREREPTSSHGT